MAAALRSTAGSPPGPPADCGCSPGRGTTTCSPSVVVPAAAGATVGVAPAAAPEIVVHVVGEVLQPGLVHLPAGARLADAIDAAGGAGPEADLAAINLARVLTDGEQVVVPRPGEQPQSAGGPGGVDGVG